MNSDHKKEIIIVTLHLTDEGTNRVLVELSNEWEKKGYKIIVVQLSPQMFTNRFDISENAEIINLRTTRFQKGFLKSANHIAGLIKVMNQHKDATVLAFTNRAIYVTGVASLFTKNRVILSERNDPYHTPKIWRRRLLRDLEFRFADGCVFQTKAAMEYYPSVVQKKSVIIPNPINPDLPEPYHGKREKIIVAACRLAEQKNIPMMIHSFELLHREHPDYKLVIYGRGECEESLQQLVESLQLKDCVSFPGFADDIYNKMRKCAIYVSSSDYEGISNSMLEALAMGLPSVVTDCPVGGARMVIESGKNGILVPVGDVQAMYLGMKKIIEEADFAQSLSLEAAKLREEYPISKISEKWLSFIEK